jgi:predicted nucleic acid-binding Zn ribbon protein
MSVTGPHYMCMLCSVWWDYKKDAIQCSKRCESEEE